MENILKYDYGLNNIPASRVVGERCVVGLIERLTILTMPDGTLRAAEIIRPDKPGNFAAVLFVHWYEPEEPNLNNRSQFKEEARILAREGTVCMLVETMWSDLDWFYKRTQEDDESNSIRQTIELRAATNLLLSEPDVDAERFAYVGHDFGAMYGILMGAMDGRPKYYVLMAGTARFSDWYLYFPRIEGEERAEFIQTMTAFDPITHIATLAPAPILFQFARQDPHVPLARAEMLIENTKSEKEVGWYQAGHGLNEQAQKERLVWLRKKLKLGGQPTK
jgi:dienelactone hydrolase